MSRRRTKAGPVELLFGWALMAAGGLIMASAGLCTLVFIGQPIFKDPSRLLTYPLQLLLILPWMAVVAGLPIGLGFLLYIWGRSLARPPNPVRSVDRDVFN